MKGQEVFRRMVVTGGLEKQEYQAVRGEVWETNRRNIFAFCIIAAVFFALMALLTLMNPALRAYRPLYLICAVISLLLILLAGGPAKGRVKLTAVLMYAFITMLLVFGIYLGTVASTHELTAAYIALLLTVPQMFTDRPWRMYVVISSSAVLFIVLCLLFKDRETWSSDITNAVAFGLVSEICCTYMMKIKLERYALEDRTRILAETDQLTGVLNRNSYELQLRRGPELDAESYFAVYVDVNGLHEMNNTLGHAAGDEMLRRVAQIMMGVFGAENTYRIGGDEFVALGLNRTEAEVEELIASLQAQVQAAGHHVACGMAWKRKAELDVTALIRSAEKNMYADKSRYYRENGLDRRRR